MAGVCCNRLTPKLVSCLRNAAVTEARSQRLNTGHVYLSVHRHNVGMFGCGRIAGVHLKNVLRNRRFDLKWIIENNSARVEEVKQSFRIGDTIPFYTPDKTHQLLTDPRLDAVMVVSPTDTHTDYICKSLEHGVAVFSEKPAGESIEDIERCYDTAEKSGKPFLTGYMRRFDKTFLDVKEAVSSGVLGTLVSIKTTFRDSPKPSYEFLKAADTSGCNILTDCGVHDIDMVTWLMQAKTPESIFVNCHMYDDNLKEVGEPDSLAAVIKYPDGTLFIMDAFRECVYGYDVRLEVFGTSGRALSENVREASTVIDSSGGSMSNRFLNSFPQRFEAAFEAELDHFADCLDGISSPVVTKKESVCVADIIDKGIRSYKEKRIVYF